MKKIHANSEPKLLYMVQRHPQNFKKAIVNLYDNIEVQDENNVYYDEYTVIVPWKDSLVMEVALNFEKWLASVKIQ